MLKEQCNITGSRGLKTGVMGEQNVLQSVLEGPMHSQDLTIVPVSQRCYSICKRAKTWLCSFSGHALNDNQKGKK